ncbi:hypothetical protein KC345_g5192 [Hortaea werneckii]|nr:hypothetical protein KC345_g5192 [Hortaea werneckii]
MDETTVRRLVEHRDILQGLDAQIARLDREEDELFGRIIRARDRDEAQVVFDALAKVKERRQRLGKERQDEAIAFGLLVSQSQRGVLPGARSSNDGERQDDGPSQPSSTNAIDASFDEDDEEPVKREASTPAGGSVLGSVPGSKTSPGGQQPQREMSTPSGRSFLESAKSPSVQQPQQEASTLGGASVPRSTTSLGGRQPQRSVTKGTELPLLAETPKRSMPPTYGAERYPRVAKTHPTLVTNPTAGEGAIELRCPYCKTNMSKDGMVFLDSVNGFSCHLALSHKSSVPPGFKFTHKRTLELCSYCTVSQDVVDAIQKGNPRAYVVEEVYQVSES